MEGRIGTAEAARKLGIKPESLYAYVSRGLLTRERGPDGRTSWFDPAEVARLAARSRHPRPPRQGGAELAIESALTTIEGGRLWYRGCDATRLATDHPFERVAWLLWTGTLPGTTTDPRQHPWPGSWSRSWHAGQSGVAVGSAAQAALPPGTLPLERLRVIAAALATTDALRFELNPTAVLATAPSLLTGLVECLPSPVDNASTPPLESDRLTSGGPPGRGAASISMPISMPISIAARLWGKLCAAPPHPDFVALLDDALVLLADHELAASTLAARVAASVRADPYAVVSVGLGAVSGALHGAVSLAVEDLLAEVGGPAAAKAAARAEAAAARAVGERLRRGERLRGFGLALYPDGDPRAAFLLERLRAIGGGAAASARLAAVEAVLDTTRRLGLPPPNVDFALGALAMVTGMIRGAGEAIFAVARTAGWLAHALEEYDRGQPLRPRALYTGPPPAADAT